MHIRLSRQLSEAVRRGRTDIIRIVGEAAPHVFLEIATESDLNDSNDLRFEGSAQLLPLTGNASPPLMSTPRQTPRDAARKVAAPAATLALIVKVAILFQVATERGAAAKNDARWGALA